MDNIKYSKKAREQLDQLDVETKRDIHSNLEAIINSEVESLERIPSSPFYRFSVRNYSIYIDWNQKMDQVYVISISDHHDPDETPKELTSDDREILLTEYSELREEIRMNQKLQHQRIIGGLTAIGAVIGYSLVSEGLVFISLVPLLVSILFVVTVRMSNATLYLGRQVYDIEQSLDVPVEEFGWESRFGGAIRSNERFSMWDNQLVSWVVVPQAMLLILILIAYLLIMWISLAILSKSNLSEFSSISPTVLAGIAYLLLTLLVIITVISYIKINIKLQPNEENNKI